MMNVLYKHECKLIMVLFKHTTKSFLVYLKTYNFFIY